MNQLVEEEIKKLSISGYDEIDLIRYKDGIYLHKVIADGHHYVLKTIEKEEYRREISNYLILQSLGLQTITLINHTDKSLLMEDINHSDKYRLGQKEDMNNADVARHLARWYRQLHQKGFQYIKDHGTGMYMEADQFTLENINKIEKETLSKYKNIWDAIRSHFSDLKNLLDNAEKTLNYNDFYYTNMIVAKDFSEAFMFDYNLLGKGYVASDLNNVTVQLSDQAKAAFLKEYGDFSQKEMLMNEVVGRIVSLYFACMQKTFPDWGYVLLKDLKDNIPSALDELFSI